MKYLTDLYKEHYEAAFGATNIHFGYTNEYRNAFYSADNNQKWVRFEIKNKPFTFYYEIHEEHDELQFLMKGLQVLQFGGSLDDANDAISKERMYVHRLRNPENGDTRIVSRCYFFPRRIGGKWRRNGRVIQQWHGEWHDIRWEK